MMVLVYLMLDLRKAIRFMDSVPSIVWLLPIASPDSPNKWCDA